MADESAIDVDVAIALASLLYVLDQATGSRAPFRMHAEQVEVFEALVSHRRVVVLKARQQGISTVCCLYDLLHAITHPGQSAAVIADTADKAQGLLAKVAAWAKQLGVPLETENVTRLVLANGASVDALSAVSHAEEGQSRVGRSKSYGMIHCSELAFWGNDRATFSALTSTALPDAKVIVESTASPAENLFRSIWDRATSLDEGDVDGWHPIFLSVEGHAAYRAAESAITDARWEALQKEYAFTRRDSAAWWSRKLDVDFQNDTHACLREFPILPAHAFTFAEGRWILSYTPAKPRVDGYWHHYVEDVAIGEPTVLGVDTSKGVGRDHSAMALIGQRTGRLLKIYKRADIDIAAYVDEVLLVMRQWKPLATVVESNGVGQATYHMLRRAMPGVEEQVSSAINGEKDIRMRRVKGAIERGPIVCGPELAHEVMHSVRNRRGDWEGPDDAINAVSFALKWLAKHPWVPPVVPIDPRTHYVPQKRKRKSLV